MKTYLKIFVMVLLCSSCSNSFLEEVPNSSILTPESVDDFQRLLDNFNIIGRASVLPQLASDEYFIISYQHWQSSRTAVERNSYVWDYDVYGGEVNVDDWNLPYKSIFYCNNIIHEINKKADDGNIPEAYTDVYGQALFQRAKVYYDLVKNYSVPYDPVTHDTDLGIPLRLDPSVDYLQQRATVKECYDQIFIDLNQALIYLKYRGPIPERNRATKLAVYAQLSRIHLYRREYKQAGDYADSVLDQYDKLIDYNTVPINQSTPFPRINNELIMYGASVSYNNSSQRNPYGDVFVDTTLIKMYHDNDLRKSIFFIKKDNGLFTVARSYNGSGNVPFNGLAVDEIYLNKIECLVRVKDLSKATIFLNKLLEKRYKTGTFIPTVFTSQPQALKIVLDERRKELVWRVLRWDDIKRLNKEGANIRLRRVLDDKEFVLEPNSSRYTFNIPQDEINRSGIIQNQR